MKFKVILADPPWVFRSWSDKGQGRSPDAHYRTMSMDDIKNLDVASVADDNSVLFLWTTWPNIADAVQVMSCWGFKYCTGLPWVKMKRDKAGEMQLQMGLGYRLRSCSEPLLIGIRGKVPKPIKASLGIVISSRQAHSEKPFGQYHFAEQYPEPRLEMFARPSLMPPEGWYQIGNEITGNDISYDLAGLARCHGKSSQEAYLKFLQTQSL